jgi:hypothetical protein
MMKRKLAALAVALLASIGMVAVAAPVSAAVPQVCHFVVADDNSIESKTCKPAPAAGTTRWSYCPVSPLAGRATFYDSQGYCGSSVAMNYPQPGTCRYMGQWDNWAGSMVNHSGQGINLWNSSGCVSGTVLGVPTNYVVPDLYPANLGNAVTAIALPGYAPGCPSCRK